MLAHGLVTPQLGSADREFMALQAETLKVDAWKCYTGSPPKGGEHGWWMDDEKIAYPFWERTRKLGVRNLCVHKGLPLGAFNEKACTPLDLEKAARDWPDLNFIVYHSSICAGQMGSGFTCTPMEGPYVAGSMQGTDALITSLMENGIAPNSNVFAELGGAFSQMMANPSACGQWLAKLVQYVGENNVVWGTDSILTGTVTSVEQRLLARRAAGGLLLPSSDTFCRRVKNCPSQRGHGPRISWRSAGAR